MTAAEQATQAAADLDAARADLRAAETALVEAKDRLVADPTDANATKAEVAERKRSKAALLVEAHERRHDAATRAHRAAERDAARKRIDELREHADHRATLARMKPAIDRLVAIESEVETIVGELAAAVEDHAGTCRQIDALARTAELAVGLVSVPPMTLARARYFTGVSIEHARAMRGVSAAPSALLPHAWLQALPEPPGSDPRRDAWKSARDFLGIAPRDLPGARMEHVNPGGPQWPHLHDRTLETPR